MNVKNRNAKYKRTDGKGNYNPKPPMKFRIINAETNELLHSLNPKAKETFRRKPFYCK